ncbi:hypothetical protein DESUT3_15530 [Desulfuromonas versatilis]|uniref:Signal transduction histidine kinase with CheB and CheR activity n=1 Tax=Desulfuromonas versatilis TaxID=2802975 RepID=A0ABN6DX95_9BACT|nr:CheR family methyltransferase [Desulfuromonas versatilis]BCR04484.1 hypothetical protein DESUT3_15530 [Desulfuromonas versatilis]
MAIGASAGSQEALEQLFTAMPADCNLAFVVIMPLSSALPSLLPETLGRFSCMEVVVAEEGMALRPNTVHVNLAASELVLSGGSFRQATPDEGSGATAQPINRFFNSLAADLGEHCIAVLLSGQEADGAEGARAVKAAGGSVLVQEPSSAIHPALPQAVVATGAADLVLPAGQMAEKIAAMAREACSLSPQACRMTTHEEDLAAVFSLVKTRTGHDFSSYKRSTVMRRIERRMAVKDVAGMKKYLALLQSSEQEPQALGQEILIGVTSFFRDPEAFETLRREIIPALFANRSADDPVRIWHACCATGEEVYSTAILIREYLSEQRSDAKVQLFATDIDQSAIAHARAGLYSEDIEAAVGKERLDRFFTRVGSRWQVEKTLREMVVFAHHSLIKDPPFSRLDLLVCRNFLIYLNPDMQQRLISLFHLALKPGGCLFLGAAETVGRLSETFSPIDKKWKIFKRLEGNRGEIASFPFLAPVLTFPKPWLPPRVTVAGGKTPAQLADKILRERYFPPCIVVSANYEVVHISAQGNRYLEVPEGEPTRDILKMAPPELRAPLRAAIYKAFSERKPVAFRGVRVSLHGHEAAVNLQVEPLVVPPAEGDLAMVVLEPAPAAASHPGPLSITDAPAGDEATKDLLIAQLEEQLRITQEQLQAVAEQLETSHEGFMAANEELMSINEEYQSANEELQSTNEELETSKEELQALNEQLVTVNTELQDKVEELDRANSDMENLFKSAEIATIFLDRQFTIRRFSPAMAELFDLIPSDIGRPFRHLAGSIDWSELREDAGEVLETLAPVEREVADREELRHFLMRVLPYRTSEGRVDGVAVTLVDITERKLSELNLQKMDKQRQLALDAARMGWWHYDPSTQIASWDERYKDIFEVSGYQRPNEEILARIHPADLPGVWAKVEAALDPANPQPYQAEYRIRLPDGSLRWVKAHGIASFEGTGQERRATSFVGTVADITARKLAEERIRSTALFPEENPWPVLRVTVDGILLYANRASGALLNQLQCSIGGAIPEFMRRELAAALEKGEHRKLEIRCGERDLSFALVPIAERGYVNLYGHDVTERNRAEAALRHGRELLSEAESLSHTGAWEYDLSTGRWTFSEEWLKIHGCPKQGLTMDELMNIAHPEDQAAIARAFEGVRNGVAPYDLEHRILRRSDGAVRTVHARGRFECDADGKVFRVYGFAQDITERKKLETQYLHAQKMESVGRLAGGVAHDFNNILTAISGFAHVTLRKMPAELPLRSNLEQILLATDRAASLTRELLLFSRKQPSERRTLDLNEILGKVEAFLQRTLGTDIDLRTLPHASPLPVLADSHQLQQVLMNLAVNARDAMPQGGTLTMQAKTVELDEQSALAHGQAKPGAYALLRVSDTGTGMDQATLKQIFEPFFTSKGVGKGTGLGLAVAYGIIKQHEGFITADSKPGQGSSFHIYLPLTTPAAASTETPEPAEEEIPGGTETLLLAEDDELVRELVTRVLEDAGYQVIPAVDGRDALQKFEEYADAIQLLLFDLVMPNMNGAEASEQIRRGRPELKVIFASGYAPEQVQQQAAIAPGSHFIFKPVAPLELLQKVRSVLDGDT